MKGWKGSVLKWMIPAVCLAAGVLSCQQKRVQMKTEMIARITQQCQAEQEEAETVPPQEETEPTVPAEEPVRTLVDSEGILVRYCGVDLEDPNLLLYFENHRDTEFSFHVDGFALNGCSVGVDNTSERIAPGESYNTGDEGLGFNLASLAEDYGITTVEEISFRLKIHEHNDEERTYWTILEEPVSIRLEEPFLLQNVTVAEKRRGDGTVLLDSDAAYVEFLGLDPDIGYDGVIDLYIHNRSDEKQWWRIEDVLINGCYTTVWNDPLPFDGGLTYRTAAFYDAVFEWDALIRYGVKEIHTLDMVLRESYTGITREVHISDLKIPVPGAEDAEEPPRKNIYTDASLDVFFCGFTSTVYSDKYTHDYNLSVRTENRNDYSATVCVTNLRIDGEAVFLSYWDVPVPGNCIYQTEANLKMEFRWDPWDAAGTMDFEVIEFDLTVFSGGEETIIPVCIHPEDLR